MEKTLQIIRYWLVNSVLLIFFLLITLSLLNFVYPEQFFPLDQSWRDIALALLGGIIASMTTRSIIKDTERSWEIDEERKIASIEKSKNTDSNEKMNLFLQKTKQRGISIISVNL